MGIYVGPPAALHGQVCLLQLMSCLGHGEEECYSLSVLVCVFQNWECWKPLNTIGSVRQKVFSILGGCTPNIIMRMPFS